MTSLLLSSVLAVHRPHADTACQDVLCGKPKRIGEVVFFGRLLYNRSFSMSLSKYFY